MLRRIVPAVAVIACLAVSIALPSAYADGTATLTGRILDPNGLPVPDAKVQAVSETTGVEYPTVTNREGFYTIPALPPNIYRIIVDKAGFKQIVKTDVTLHVEDVAALNFDLQVGSTSETVTVNGSGLVINTTDAAVSTVVDRDFVANLPLNGRSFNTLLQLTPGVVLAPSNAGEPGQFSINGQRTNANYFTIDGVSVNFGVGVVNTSFFTSQSGGSSAPAFNAYGGTSSLVSVDALEEFRIETSTYAPEYGRAPGGQVAIETRSGTNDFHGAIFDYFRNTVLDANDWFANAAGQQRAPEHQNDFGGTFGGPIRHSKTFIFFSYEALRLQQPQSFRARVPSLALRNDPNTLPAAQLYFNAYPVPNGKVLANGVAFFTGGFSNQVTQNAGSMRIDHALNDKWKIFGRYNDAPSQLKLRGGNLAQVQKNDLDTKTVTLGVTGVLTPRITNSFRGNYSIQKNNGSTTLDSFGGAVVPNAATLLPPPLTTGNSSALFLPFQMSSFFFGTIAKNQESQVNLVDNVAVSSGSHQLRFGVDYRRLPYSLPGVVEAFYEIFSIKSFATTAQADLFVTQLQLPVKILFHSTSLYGQDTWRLGRRLVLTYGVRWEYNPAPSAQGNTTLAAWSNTDNAQATVLASPGTALWKNTYNNFAPRLGAAYQLNSKGDFVIRGGWGLFYDLGTGVVTEIGQTFPNSGLLVAPSSVPLPISDASPFIPAAPSLTSPYNTTIVNAFDDNLKLPRSYQWNLALEKSFRAQNAISVTYVGQEGRRLLRQEVVLQPNSNFLPGSAFQLTKNAGTSDYHALQTQYRRPLSKGLQVLLNYTWSHSIDTGSSDAAVVNPSTIIPVASDRGSSSFDVRHNISGAFNYNLPGIGREWLLSKLSREWSLDGVVQARSGFPIDVTTIQVVIPGVSSTTRPDVVPGVAFWLSDPTAPGGKTLNPTAFSIPQQPRQGTLGRNAISGFGFTQVDLSLARRFSLTERVKVYFRSDVFNVLNHPNFPNPDSNLDDLGAGFGMPDRMLNKGLGGLNALYQVGGPRSIQLSLKLQF